MVCLKRLISHQRLQASSSKTSIEHFITTINSNKVEESVMIANISNHDAQILYVFNINSKHKNKLLKSRLFRRAN